MKKILLKIAIITQQAVDLGLTFILSFVVGLIFGVVLYLFLLVFGFFVMLFGGHKGLIHYLKKIGDEKP